MYLASLARVTTHESLETIAKSETMNTQSSGGPAPAPGFLQVIWQAIRGTQISYDYTEGDIGHAIMLLAVPMVQGDEALGVIVLVSSL